MAVKYSELLLNASDVGYYRLSDAMVRRAVSEGREVVTENISVTTPAPGHTSSSYAVNLVDNKAGSGSEIIAWGVIGKTPAQINFCNADGESLRTIVRTLQALNVDCYISPENKVFVNGYKVTDMGGWIINPEHDRILATDD